MGALWMGAQLGGTVSDIGVGGHTSVSGHTGGIWGLTLCNSASSQTDSSGGISTLSEAGSSGVSGGGITSEGSSDGGAGAVSGSGGAANNIVSRGGIPGVSFRQGVRDNALGVSNTSGKDGVGAVHGALVDGGGS